jgi:hypothetical protein
LFLPTKLHGGLSAFNLDCPLYFLNLNSDPLFIRKAQRKEWILATISNIVDCIAGVGADENPFKLAIGTKYFLCDAKPFRKPILG